MADSPSQLTAWRVGGQVDPAWLETADPDAEQGVNELAGRTWDQIRVTTTLSTPTGGAPIVDPTNGAHIHPLSTVETLARDVDTGAPSDGQWHTDLLKAVIADDPDEALQPTGLVWQLTVEIDADPAGNGTRWTTVNEYDIQIDADRDYVAEGETVTVNGLTCIDVNALIAVPVTTPPTTAFADAVQDVLDADPTFVRVWRYASGSYGPDRTARIFIQRPGDPDPTGLGTNDIVIPLEGI